MSATTRSVSVTEENHHNLHPLSIAHINIRSLNSCFDEFCDLVARGEFDVVAVSESWLTVADLSYSFALPDYNFVRSDRDSRDSGLCCYIRKNIKHELIFTEMQDIEQMWLILKNGTYKIALGICYRPPHANVQLLNRLEETLRDICSSSDIVVLVGDLNIDCFQTNSATYRHLNTLLGSFQPASTHNRTYQNS